jgi:hypothetical protein
MPLSHDSKKQSTNRRRRGVASPGTAGRTESTKRIFHHRTVLLLGAGLVALAGLAWGAGVRSYSKQATPTAAPAPVPATAPTSAPTTTAPLAARAIEQSPVADAHTQQAGASATSSTEAGMRIFKDPETGQIGMPTPEALAPLATTPENFQFKQVRLPDGSYMVNLEGHNQETMVMHIDAKGNRSVSCVTDPSVKSILNPAPAQTPKREEQ